MLDLSRIPPLKPFSWQTQDLSPWQEYLDYYGINLSQTLAINVDHHLGEMHLGGYNIAVQYFAVKDVEAKGSVLLLHGYMDHVGLYRHLLKSLLENGFNVLAYDLPGHGLSSGEPAGIADFQDYQKIMQALLAQADRALYASKADGRNTVTLTARSAA